jgi:predicted RNA-binding protein YlxR (DUF448 family)
LSGSRRKHKPLRTCIACQQKRPKRSLLRVVRTLEGKVDIDPKGKAPGRGAYLCPTRQCLDGALHPGKLSRALKCQVSLEEATELKASAELLLVEEPWGEPD